MFSDKEKKEYVQSIAEKIVRGEAKLVPCRCSGKPYMTQEIFEEVMKKVEASKT